MLPQPTPPYFLLPLRSKRPFPSMLGRHSNQASKRGRRGELPRLQPNLGHDTPEYMWCILKVCFRYNHIPSPVSRPYSYLFLFSTLILGTSFQNIFWVISRLLCLGVGTLSITCKRDIHVCNKSKEYIVKFHCEIRANHYLILEL